MTALEAERKLVAILCADVAGYSRMIGEDEEATLAALAAHLSELIAPAVASQHGRIVKTMGDGFLAEFASPVAAARCAFDIQEGLRRRNEGIPEPKQQWLRIGLNLGDVSVRDGDLFGDAVNVAARLQSLAEPGEVYASAAVLDQLRGHPGFGWDDLGDKPLKNIARPVFRLRAADGAQASPPVSSEATAYRHPRHAAGRRHPGRHDPGGARLRLVRSAFPASVAERGGVAVREPERRSQGRLFHALA
jgi:adenylate cyclase